MNVAKRQNIFLIKELVDFEPKSKAIFSEISILKNKRILRKVYIDRNKITNVSIHAGTNSPCMQSASGNTSSVGQQMTSRSFSAGGSFSGRLFAANTRLMESNLYLEFIVNKKCLLEPKTHF